MKDRIDLRQLRPALAVLGVVAAFTGCSPDDHTPLDTPSTADLAVGVEVSSANAKAGDQIALAIKAQPASGIELGVVQGKLVYDANRLSYVGQAAEGSKVTLLNDKKAGQGEIRLISWDVKGIGNRTGTLVFKAKTPDYTRGLRFDLELASDRKGELEIRRATSISTTEAADLRIPAGAHRMLMADWNEALYPGLAAKEAKARLITINQPTIPGEHYGNANLSAETGSCTGAGGYVNGLDVTYIANLSVGNFDITGTDFPTRDPIIVANVAPATSSPAPGINSNGSRTVDGLDVGAVANEVVGNARPIVCDAVPGIGGGPSGTVTVSGTISNDTTWTNTKIIRLDGIVRVNGGATLTIQPGSQIEGLKVSTAGSPSALYIERDGRIEAVGLPQQPIVFTCDQAVKTKGCWGGVVIAGNGQINGGQGTAANTDANSPVIAGRAATGGCLEQDYEGSGPNPVTLLRFGGCNNADSSGVVKFARFEYGGFIFASNKELNNFTLGAVGSKTVIDFVQVHAGNDDGLEIFGGGVNIRHLLSTANSDDSFDYSQGWNGNAQFVIIQEDSLDSDKGLEIDNTEPGTVPFTTTPITTGPLFNATLIGTKFPNSTSGNPNNNVNDAINVRRGSHTPFFDMVMIGYPTLMDLDEDETCGADATVNVAWQSVVSADFTRIDNTDLETNCPPFAAGISVEGLLYNTAAFGNATAASGTAILRDPYNVLVPDFRPVSAAAVFNGASTAPPAGQGLDVTANYRGAVSPASNVIPWYLPWSRVWANATTP
ncbi:MAG TPA: hypothetical protein VFU03_10620 [Gemmatimonadales bacterium]|nr:hypothetical protein [Gemmatimonadales bacterium]